MIEHWLYKNLNYKVEIECETRCNECFHNHVCSHQMEKRCVNYVMGTSEFIGCQGCTHRFPRYDSKQPVPCFHCEDFHPKDETFAIPKG